LTEFDIEGKDTAELIRRYKKTGDMRIRNAVVEKNLRLAEGIAARFTGRGVDYEDLLQVACLALIGAIERFDPDRGFKFSTFAAPTMIGEIKNYFRDKTRMVHISRRDSEQLLAYGEAREQLEKKGRVTTSVLASQLQVSEERVLELMDMQRSLSVSSLERLLGEGETDGTMKDILGGEDSGFSQVENKEFLQKALEHLNCIERQILRERFWRRLPQSEVAAHMGVSQMYVSRAERRILAKLKGYLLQ